MKTFQYQLQQKLDEVYSVEPNDLGVDLLTFIYKKSTSYLKSLPFVIIIPLSLFIAVLVYLLIGRIAIKVTSLLQYGF